MIGIFKDRNAFVVPMLFVVAFALKFAFIRDPLPAEAATAGGILDKVIYKVLWQKVNAGVLAIICISIIVFSGIALNYMLAAKRMYQRSHMLTALSFVLFTSLFAGLQRMQAGILMLPITLLLYGQMTKLYQSAHPKTVVVNIGLIVGLGTLLYHPYWWMLPCCYVALMQMRPFRFNEWVLLLIGFLIPAYVVLSYEYLTDQWNPAQHWPVWDPMKTLPDRNPWWIAAIALSIIWVITGFSAWQDANRRMLIQTRKNWYLLLIMGLFTLPSIFYPQGNLYEGITLLLLPTSALAAHAFTGESRSGLKLYFFWFIVVSCIVLSWAVIAGKM
ncbi:MAG TPA: DUF6427 family protein [Phnomibacter sp.]|nr:DUF6427 family protein [Phnomibacter sp.]